MNPANEKKTRDRESSSWSFPIFCLIGAAAVTVVVLRLRRAINYANQVRSKSSWNGTTGSSTGGSFREESWNRFNRRMQDEYEDEMERVERIRRMQSVFNRGGSRHNKTYESWKENGPGADQRFQRDDWSWKVEWSWKENPSSKYQRTTFRSTLKDTGRHAMSHHYSVLGLDRTRATPYSDAEIKTAFRAKAMQFHPDQNQNNKDAAEAKFKEVMASYEAIKSERNNGNC